MSSFEFVAVLFSVIIGLAISHLLAAVSDLVESSKRVKLYWITSIWIITVLIWDIFSWWGLWELQSLEFWNYPSIFSCCSKSKWSLFNDNFSFATS